MSDGRVVGLVCEGPTDIYLVREIVQEVWPEVSRVLPLQPELDALDEPRDRSGGWSEVQRWCKRADLDELLDPIAGDPLDALVIVVDVDIAVDAGIADPPAETGPYETQRLCDVVKSWLSREGKNLPKQVVIAIAAMAVEAWVVAALFPKEKRPEQIPDPAIELVKRGVLRTGARGRPSKWPPLYRGKLAHAVRTKVDGLRKRCPEAERLARKLEARRADCGD